MFKSCFITLLIGLFSPICAVFAAEAPEIQARWNEHRSLGGRVEAQAFVTRKYPGLIFTNQNDANEARIKALISKVDRAYREQFPKLMSNKSFPDFVVIESSNWTDLQVLAEADLNQKINHSVLIVPSGLIKEINRRGEAGILALLAHELAHIYLHHTNVDYFVLDARDSGANTRLSNARLQALNDFLKDSWIAGTGFSTGFAGQPFGLSLLRDDFRHLLAQFLNSNPNENCAALSFHNYRFAMIPLFNNNYSDADGLPRFKDQFEELTAAASIEGFQEQLLECSRKTAFKSELLQKRYFPYRTKNLSSAEFIALRLGRPFQWKEQDEFSVLLELSKKIHADMRASFESNKLQDVQWRSFEDEADDFAIAIMRRLGLRAEDFTGMLLEILETTQPGAQMTCRSAIAAQVDIPYGGIVDPHHSLCWRTREFESRFNAGTGK